MADGTPAPGWAEAVAELEGILAGLEGDDVDVDVLSRQVQRAAELLAVCRARIDAARFEVARVVDRLDDTDGGDQDGDDQDGDRADGPTPAVGAAEHDADPDVEDDADGLGADGG